MSETPFPPLPLLPERVSSWEGSAVNSNSVVNFLTAIEFAPTMKPERRHQSRTKLDRISYMQIETDNGGIISDLSEGGLCFQAVAAVNCVTQLRVRFSSPTNGQIDAQGELQWLDETKKRGGLRFLQPSKDAQQYIQELLAPPVRPAEQHLDSTPAATTAKAATKFTRLIADRRRSSGRNACTIPPVSATDSSHVKPNSSAQSAGCDSIQNEESVPSQPTSAMLPRASLYDIREPKVSNPDPQEFWAHECRQQYRRGLLTGITASVIVVIGVFASHHRQIGDALVHRGEELSRRSEPGTPRLGAPAATSTLSAAAPSTSTLQEVPSGQPGTRASPDSANKSVIVSDRSDSSMPETLRAGKPTGSHAAREKFGSQAAPSEEYGQHELNLAEQLLSGSKGSPNSRTAAQWLWAAVKKGNVTAEVALSDLYVTGEGVEKNCEQARVLLQAAAKKGNTSAVEKLRTEGQSACR